MHLEYVIDGIEEAVGELMQGTAPRLFIILYYS